MHDISIRLDDERDAYIVSDIKEFVHKKELEQVKCFIADSLDKAAIYLNSNIKSKSGILPTRRHDTVMLAGVRGSGKTTFMLTLLGRP